MRTAPATATKVPVDQPEALLEHPAAATTTAAPAAAPASAVAASASVAIDGQEDVKNASSPEALALNDAEAVQETACETGTAVSAATTESSRQMPNASTEKCCSNQVAPKPDASVAAPLPSEITATAAPTDATTTPASADLGGDDVVMGKTRWGRVALKQT